MATGAQTIIDAIDDAIAAMLAGGAAQTISYSDGRSVTYHSLADLRAARAAYAAELGRAQINSSDKRPIKVFGIGFGRPS